MALITKTFTYEGGVRIAEVPAGTTQLTLHIWAGAGGGGGTDAGGDGGSGSSGHYVTKTNLDMTAYAGVKNISVSVGGGGSGGTQGQGSEGGANGKSISNFSGGTGGPSGSSGISGSGGGGGGATVVAVFDDGASPTQTVLAIAGGGAGGGGAGRLSTGGVGTNTSSATSRTPGTLGENGASHEADGGGAGAGGGGADGGTGGSGDQGDIGAFGGRAGSNTVPASGSADDGSGITPGGASSGHYSTGVAVGGASLTSGADGRAVLIFNIPSASNYKVAGEWKKLDQIYHKVSGAWKNIKMGYTKVGGAWKAFFANDIAFHINYAAFGDPTGNPTSGSAGVAGAPVVTPDNIGSGGGGDGRIVTPKCKKNDWHVHEFGFAPFPASTVIGTCSPGKGSNPRVICTWLTNHGLMSDSDLLIDNIYSVKNISENTKLGYWFWAIPYVRLMDNQYKKQTIFGKYLVRFSKAIAQSRTNEIKREIGYIQKHDYLGKITRIIGENLSMALGFTLKPFIKQRFSKWLSETDPRKMDW
jgi:hypothetical protein